MKTPVPMRRGRVSGRRRMRYRAESWFAAGNNGNYYALANPGAGNYAFGGSANGVMVTAPGQYNGNKSPLFNIGRYAELDSGKHSFKFGAEVRLTSVRMDITIFRNSRSRAFREVPEAILLRSGPPFQCVSTLAGGTPSATVTTGNKVNISNMLYFLNGSVNGASMLYWITAQDDVPTQFGGTSTRVPMVIGRM